MGAEMQRVSHGQDIDLRGWQFFASADPFVVLREIFVRGFAAPVTDRLREQFKHDPPSLEFAFLYGDSDGMSGPPPSDPVMLYLNLQLGEDENGVTYACSLEAVVDDLLEAHMMPASKKMEGAEEQAICRKVAARLRELAAKLETACTVE